MQQTLYIINRQSSADMDKHLARQLFTAVKQTVSVNKVQAFLDAYDIFRIQRNSRVVRDSTFSNPQKGWKLANAVGQQIFTALRKLNSVYRIANSMLTQYYYSGHP